MPALAEHVRESPAGVLRQVRPQELRAPQPRAEDRGHQRMIAHALRRPPPLASAQRLCGREQSDLLQAGEVCSAKIPSLRSGRRIFHQR
jgi:hypothetical protein